MRRDHHRENPLYRRAAAALRIEAGQLYTTPA